MNGPTEPARRARLAEINSQPKDRAALEALYGRFWDTRELARDFVVIGFVAPIIGVRRKTDGAKGSLEFQHQPRLYFNFQTD
jgi:hypothetical protein